MIEFTTKNFPGLVISQELEEDLQKMSIALELDEGHSLLQPRQSLQSVYFVKSGVIRSSVKKVQIEFTNWFYGKGDIMIAAESFFLDTESGFLWEASCTSQIIEIKKKDFFFLSEKHPTFKHLTDLLLFDYLKKRDFHQYILSARRGQERYEEFDELFRHITLNVQVQHLASFLGMKPDSLSRIRGRNT